MGLYNFQKRFVPFILSGKKQHTIRATRKHSDTPGNICHLYTGLRVKGATMLLGRFPCTRVETIEIVSGCSEDDTCNCSAIVLVAGVELDKTEREKLAKLDGFKTFAEMAQFWKGRIPFAGHIIHWKWSKGDTGYDITHGVKR
jgi:hypothetical protein